MLNNIHIGINARASAGASINIISIKTSRRGICISMITSHIKYSRVHIQVKGGENKHIFLSHIEFLSLF